MINNMMYSFCCRGSGVLSSVLGFSGSGDPAIYGGQLLCIGIANGEGHPSKTQAKQVLISSPSKKHIWFGTFCLSEASGLLGDPWVPSGCLWVPPGCLLGASQVPLGCQVISAKWSQPGYPSQVISAKWSLPGYPSQVVSTRISQLSYLSQLISTRISQPSDLSY